MKDKKNWEEKNWEQKLRKRLKVSNEQLLKEMKEAEESVKDTDFPGVEDRLFRRLMERKAAEEEEARKKTQIRRKRKMAAVALVAVFMMALGFTAVGEKSYFFRYREKEEGVVFNNDQNKIAVGKLEEAYLTIEKTFNIKVPRLGYRPKDLKFDELNISGDTAIIAFEYKDKKIYFIQEYQDTQASRGTTSDREDIDKVHNEWMKIDIIIDGNQLNSEEMEYGAQFNIGNYIYRICGIMEEKEFKEIVENIYFFK